MAHKWLWKGESHHQGVWIQRSLCLRCQPAWRLMNVSWWGARWKSPTGRTPSPAVTAIKKSWASLTAWHSSWNPSEFKKCSRWYWDQQTKSWKVFLQRRIPSWRRMWFARNVRLRWSLVLRVSGAGSGSVAVWQVVMCRVCLWSELCVCFLCASV